MVEIRPLAGTENKFKADDLVCYCFDYTTQDIENDFIEHGKSTIFENIARAKRNNGCDCAVKNPKGR